MSSLRCQERPVHIHQLRILIKNRDCTRPLIFSFQSPIHLRNMNIFGTQNSEIWGHQSCLCLPNKKIKRSYFVSENALPFSSIVSILGNIDSMHCYSWKVTLFPDWDAKYLLPDANMALVFADIQVQPWNISENKSCHFLALISL
jgi:hypothetical protein